MSNEIHSIENGVYRIRKTPSAIGKREVLTAQVTRLITENSDLKLKLEHAELKEANARKEKNLLWRRIKVLESSLNYYKGLDNLRRTRRNKEQLDELERNRHE